LAIVELRRRRLTQARIAASLGVSKSTVSRVLARAGLSRLRDREPSAPAVRYKHAAPGDLIHIDTKKLGRIEKMGHRITGNRRDSTEGARWEFLFVAIDDHARIGFTDLYPDERKSSAVQFLGNTVAYFKSLGVSVRRILTDNGSAFRSQAFAKACRRLGLKHSFTRAYRPQTNGKAERFIQSALREWAYGIAYHHSSERADMLDRWIHHYNWHRPHQGIGGLAPISRLPQSRNNLLTLHMSAVSAGCCGSGGEWRCQDGDENRQVEHHAPRDRRSVIGVAVPAVPEHGPRPGQEANDYAQRASEGEKSESVHRGSPSEPGKASSIAVPTLYKYKPQVCRESVTGSCVATRGNRHRAPRRRGMCFNERRGRYRYGSVIAERPVAHPTG
jgi:transposase InsO family protein